MVPKASDSGVLPQHWLRDRFRATDPSGTFERWVGPCPAEANWWFATDGDDVPVGLGVITLDAEWALLHGLVTRSHPARWMLHTRLVTAAIEARARCMCVHEGNVLLLSPGLRYFQQRLGYRAAHLALEG